MTTWCEKELFIYLILNINWSELWESIKGCFRGKNKNHRVRDIEKGGDDKDEKDKKDDKDEKDKKDDKDEKDKKDDKDDKGRGGGGGAGGAKKLPRADTRDPRQKPKENRGPEASSSYPASITKEKASSSFWFQAFAFAFLICFLAKVEWLFLIQAPCDAAEPWQLGFQDAATPMMQGIIDLHHDIFFFLILIFVFVSRILVRALWHFHYKKNPIPQRIVHGTTIEILRTIFPSIIPMFIAIPSFALLYSMDEVVVDPAITIKAIGHQWYRTYEYSDYNSSDEQSLTFDSYTIPEDDLELGQSRLLEVDNRVVVPAKTHLRIIVTPADVPHSWAVPSLGVKCDAVPGRLNQISISVQREGVYYGQCSEICGTNHAFTPIVVEAVPSKDYGSRVSNQLIPQTTGEA